MAVNNEPGFLSSKLTTALKVASLAGVSGLAVGGISGILRGRYPVVRSIAFGIQWTVFGVSYWILRDSVLTGVFDEDVTPLQRASVSAVAAGIAGGATTYTLVSRRFVPAFVTLSIGGFAGQKAYDTIDAWQLRRKQEEEAAPHAKKPFGQRLLESRWTLLKSLSDEDYIEMLEERKTNVEIEIALVDDKMAELRKKIFYQMNLGARPPLLVLTVPIAEIMNITRASSSTSATRGKLDPTAATIIRPWKGCMDWRAFDIT
ncbi:hypothetical protein AAP_06062 [Ascosphaera apis ARSEF 7405]|uniref:Uncharacterized protein n=1 Tax=Ascosphaera apis ARSEF 7405 TaxID=392613 RepID=A0A162ICA2_9EURO|nr:hypothetical protein AAP_06062 [Ascosphaera apis ARSEF 7405]